MRIGAAQNLEQTVSHTRQGSEVRRVSTDSTARLLAGRTSPVQGRDAAQRLKTLDALYVKNAWWRRGEVSERYAKTYKTMTAEGGYLKTLCTKLVGIKEGGCEGPCVDAKVLLGLETYKIKVQGWFGGSARAGAFIKASDKGQRSYLTMKLKVWAAEAETVVERMNAVNGAKRQGTYLGEPGSLADLELVSREGRLRVTEAPHTEVVIRRPLRAAKAVGVVERMSAVNGAKRQGTYLGEPGGLADLE